LGEGQVVDCSGHGGENLGSVTYGEFLDWLGSYKLFEKGLWPMQGTYCVLTGLTPIVIKIEEACQFYQ